MADYLDDIYAEIDKQFEQRLGNDRFSGLPTVDPTPYEVAFRPLEPEGWIDDGAISDIAIFASTIRPPVVVDSLPALPDSLYGIGSFAYLTTDGKLYRNRDNSTWSVAADGADIIANSITAGQIAVGAIGADQIAAQAITADKIATGALSADDISAGTLRISPQAEFADGIEIINADGLTIGLWNELGIKIWDPTDFSRFLTLDGGSLKITLDGGVTFDTVVEPEGIHANAILLGQLPGGHNVILNSSFELADFISVPSIATFTSTVSTPGWAAANRVNAPTQITEGTELVMAQLAF